MAQNEIILNEREYVEKALESGDLGRKPTRVLGLAARYWRENGYSKDEIRQMLEALIVKSDPNASVIKWDSSIAWAVRYSDKELIYVENVPITKVELDICKSVGNRQKQRVMFSLFCLAKFGHIINPKNMGWVSATDSQIFSLANVVTTIRRQSLMLNELMTAGYVEFAKSIDSTSIKVVYMDLESPPALQITDFRNLGNQYNRYMGESYIECERCGLVVKRKSNKQIYCKECGRVMNIQNTAARRREKARLGGS